MGETNWLQFIESERAPREGGEGLEGLDVRTTSSRAAVRASVAKQNDWRRW